MLKTRQALCIYSCAKSFEVEYGVSKFSCVLSMNEEIPFFVETLSDAF